MNEEHRTRGDRECAIKSAVARRRYILTAAVVITLLFGLSGSQNVNRILK
jgi:hypothetical protein